MGDSAGDPLAEALGVVRVGDPGREMDWVSGLPDTTLSRIAIEFMVWGSKEDGSARRASRARAERVEVISACGA